MFEPETARPQPNAPFSVVVHDTALPRSSTTEKWQVCSLSFGTAKPGRTSPLLVARDMEIVRNRLRR